MHKPFFSIIIPVYNVAPYLRACLDSLLAQRYNDWECLCIDDGSTDGSSVILDEYAQRDARFRIFHKTNEGVSIARNLGLDHAIGQWLCFVDSDDQLTEDALEVCAKGATADIVYFGMDFCYPKGDIVTYKYRAIAPTHIDDETSYEVLHMVENPMQLDIFGFTCNKIIKREIVEVAKIRFEAGISCWEDALFTLKVFMHARTFAVLDASLYLYRRLETSLTHQQNKPMLKLGTLFEAYGNEARYRGLKTFAYQRAYCCYRWDYTIKKTLACAKKLIALCTDKHHYLKANDGFCKRCLRLAKLPGQLPAFTLLTLSKIKSLLKRCLP